MIPKESAPLPGFFPGFTFTTYALSSMSWMKTTLTVSGVRPNDCCTSSFSTAILCI